MTSLLSFLKKEFFVIIAIAVVAFSLIAGDAFAADIAEGEAANVTANPFAVILCKALNIVTGTAGRAFAAFAIIAVAMGFFTSKVSWATLIAVSLGIAFIFGAPQIVSLISGTAVLNCGEISKRTIDGAVTP